MDISIVTGTYNRLTLLKRMVEMTRVAAEGFTYEIIVVDAGSPDGTESWCELQDDIVLIQHGRKLGPVLAFNDGFKAAQGTYVVPLNDDAAPVETAFRLAFDYLEKHALVGAVAFKNITPPGSPRAPYDYAARGYVYPQTGMIRRWLGELAGWWGVAVDRSKPTDDQIGYLFYGGDTNLGARIWELGYEVATLDGCAVIDDVHDDDLRRENNTGDVRMHDNGLYHMLWRGRLPAREAWRPVSDRGRIVYEKAMAGELTTLRLKSSIHKNTRMRTGMIEAFDKYGTGHQLDQTALLRNVGQVHFQYEIISAVNRLEPDLLILQAQGGDGIVPSTIRDLRRLQPDMFIANFNGDARVPVPTACIEIAQLCDLSLVCSPDLFSCYAKCGAMNVAYWPITYEREFMEVVRPQRTDLDHHVIFMGTNYANTIFPDAPLRRDALKTLHNAGIPVSLYGAGWEWFGQPLRRTDEQHEVNARAYANSKLALSISHFNDLYGYTSDRLYLAAATGCPVLVKSFPGMQDHGFVDGLTCITFDTLPELVEKTRYYLNESHAEEREAIGRRGKSMVESTHSWDQRVLAFFDQIRVRAPSGLFGTQEYIAMRGLKGRNDMPCGGCGAKDAVPSNLVQSGILAAAADIPGTVEGMSVVVYVGRATNKQHFGGPVTGVDYEFKPGRPRYVDTRDLYTPQGSQTLGLLDNVDKLTGSKEIALFGKQEVAVQLAQPEPVVEPTPSAKVPAETLALVDDAGNPISVETRDGVTEIGFDNIDQRVETGDPVVVVEPITAMTLTVAKLAIKDADEYHVRTWADQERGAAKPRKTVLDALHRRLSIIEQDKAQEQEPA